MAQQAKPNLTKNLEKLNEIVEWFEQQENVDVEAGLEKVREAAQLIKSSKGRLAEIENEFKEIEKDITEEVAAESADEPSEGSGAT
jgi:exonuclease VII small subunit